MNECDVPRGYPDIIAPWLEEAGVRGSLPVSGGVSLRHLYIESPAECAALVFVCGYHENFLKYGELFYDMKADGLSVYACDMRGQGFSDHLLPEPQTAYVEKWEHYVEDLALSHGADCPCAPASSPLHHGTFHGGSHYNSLSRAAPSAGQRCDTLFAAFT